MVGRLSSDRLLQGSLFGSWSVSGLAIRSVFALFYGGFSLGRWIFIAKEQFLCIHCGEMLDAQCFPFDRVVCLSCQEKIFEELEEKNGCHMAIFLACGMFNLPCVPDIVPVDLCESEVSHWRSYCELLSEWDGMVKADGELCGFTDGECDIRRIFGRNVTEQDFGRYIAVEKERLARLPGTAAQRARWGTECMWKGLVMTSEDRKSVV